MNLVNNSAEKAEVTIDYLRKHPDFFIHHPEILTTLNVPHDTDKNVSSLIEYQVSRLRHQTAELQKSINSLKEDACVKRELAEHIHSLSLSIQKVTNFKQLYELVSRGLKRDYSASQVLLYLFKKCNSENIDYSGIKFLDKGSKLSLMFTEIFHRGKALCGSLQEEHIEALFGKNHNTIRSTILIPLIQPDWQGLLVIGSQKNNCYSHGFELDLLVYLSRVITPVINKQS